MLSPRTGWQALPHAPRDRDPGGGSTAGIRIPRCGGATAKVPMGKGSIGKGSGGWRLGGSREPGAGKEVARDRRRVSGCL